MPSSPRGHVVDASGDVIDLLGRKRVVRVRRLAFVTVFAFVSWSCFQGAQNSIRAHRKRSLLHTHYVANARERVKSELAPCIDPNEETARAMESSSSDESALRFVTFAFTRDPGARWEAASARRALRLMYSSLARAHAILPGLHVYTDSPEVIPSETSFGVKTKIHVHTCASDSFPFNPYTKIGKWAQISRAKLDVVEDVLLKYGGRVIWVDLDTLVFVDLSDTFKVATSWIVGYQRGADTIFRKIFSKKVRPEFDALGDVWSLDAKTIGKVRDFERRVISQMKTPPKYDLQTYFGLMLEEGSLSRDNLLNRLLPSMNFGFFCSNFNHPTSKNLKLSQDANGTLVCGLKPGVEMGARVGAISFTAKSIVPMLLTQEYTDFDAIRDLKAREWLKKWFYAHDTPLH